MRYEVYFIIAVIIVLLAAFVARADETKNLLDNVVESNETYLPSMGGTIDVTKDKICYDDHKEQREVLYFTLEQAALFGMILKFYYDLCRTEECRIKVMDIIIEQAWWAPLPEEESQFKQVHPKRFGGER